jgi:hypothetical protein
MKPVITITCENCNEKIKTDHLKKDGENIFVLCKNCNNRNHLAVTSFIPKIKKSENLCPKCNSIKTDDSDSCTKCGLIYEKWKGHIKPFNDFPKLKKKWKELSKLPVDHNDHNLFLEDCFNSNALNDAVKAYNNFKTLNQVDVSKKIRQIQILAQMSIGVKKEKKKKKKISWVFIIILVVITLIFFYIWSISPEDLLSG